MDYGFVPGRDRYAKILATVFSHRGTLVRRKGLATVQGFVKHLADPANRPQPVDDLLVGAHATSQGTIQMKMFPKQVGNDGKLTGTTDFEILSQALQLPENSVKIPDSVIDFVLGSPITHSFHFKGCNVGKDRTDRTRNPESRFPFLLKVQEALGSHVHVTAPKHFHGLTPHKLGSFEYMCYEFVVRMPARLIDTRFEGVDTRDHLIDEFKALAYQFVNQELVPDDAWGGWLPKNVRKERRTQVPSTLGVKYGRVSTVLTPQQYRIDTTPIQFTRKYPSAAEIPPANDWQAAIRDGIRALYRFKDEHPFPVFERAGYKTFDDFWNGYHWSIAPSGDTLIATGRRYIYTLLLAIRDQDENLIFNFYPAPGSTHAAVTTALVETDDSYFGSV
ncbi:hypothetical protein [Arthrobacter ruber]|uniref:hypothetical protein n=1 Tax=Arthrobacter ruber TaxID=1258893 RepID=UPI00130006DA|nr:hypothetical protein [Arthrobacter ruber]